MDTKVFRETQKEMIIGAIDYFADKIIDMIFDYTDLRFDLMKEEKEE